MELGLSKSGVNDYLNSKLKEVIKAPIKDGPRTLLFDLENAPSIGVAFQRFKVNLSPDHILDEGGWLISACWKFLGEDKMYKIVLTPEEAIARDDSRIVAELYEAFEETDIAIGQNIDRFDLALFKTRCIAHGFGPPKTVKTIDTLKIAKQLKFNSNKLDSLGAYLGLGRKMKHTGIDLWIRCMQGDSKALAEMLEYNEQDVLLLEAVYLKVRAFDSKAPNLGHFYAGEEVRCPACGSTDVSPTGHSIFTQISEFKEMKCNDCGHRSRERTNISTKGKKANVLITPKLTG